jgi:iron complex outermembrane receptor protein
LPTARALADPAPGAAQEVVVTAQKRTESIKNVPLAITAVSGATLQRQGFVNFNDIASIAPNMVALQLGDSRTSTIAMRGVTTQQADIGQQASLGVFVDGVFMSRTGMGTTQDFVDIERIEVLRGPQGTLFGMNTAGGLMNIITRKPNLNALEGNVDLSYGSYNDVRARGMVTGPIIPGALGFSLAAYSDSHDGYTYDTVTHQHVDNERKEGGRAKIEYSQGDFDATFTADYQHETSQCCSVVISKLDPGANVFGIPIAPIAPKGYPYSRQTIEDGVNTNPNSGGGVSAELNWRLSQFTVTSVSSWRTWDAFPIADVDELSYNFLDGFSQHQTHTQASEELRLTSPGDQKLAYVLGVFYFWRHSNEADNLPVGPDASFLIMPGQPGNTANAESVDDVSYAAFGHADYHLTDKLTISGGLRYSDEPQTGSYVQRSTNFVFPDLGPVTQKRSDSALTWQAAIAYKWTPDVMLYANAASGFKPGGFDMTRLGNLSGFQFRPETNIDYEGGVKASLLDQRLSIDADLFWTNYTNFQALSFDGTNLITRNAGAFLSRGIEVQIDAYPTRGLTLSANGSYLDAHYTSFPNGQCPVGQSGSCNLSGYRLYGAPTWTFNASGQYIHPIADGWDGFARFDVSYKSGIYVAENLDPGTYQPPYAVLNTRIGVNDHHGLQVSLFANNVTETKYMNYTFLAPLSTGVYVGYVGAPRVVGVEVRKAF